MSEEEIQELEQQITSLMNKLTSSMEMIDVFTQYVEFDEDGLKIPIYDGINVLMKMKKNIESCKDRESLKQYLKFKNVKRYGKPEGER